MNALPISIAEAKLPIFTHAWPAFSKWTKRGPRRAAAGPGRRRPQRLVCHANDQQRKK